MSFAIGNLALQNPVLLAPMAGITDLPFRRQVARFGQGADGTGENAPGLMVSEMIASREAAQGDARARAKAEIDGALGATSVQLAARDPEWIAEAARYAEGQGAPVIDINMGCPARKVTGGQSGSALMREPDHALRLIEATVAAVSVPVTVKMRLGWDEGMLNAPQLTSEFLPTGLLPQIAADLAGRPAPAVPGLAEQAESLADHYRDMLAFYGRDVGLRCARKHLDWRLSDLPGGVALRDALVRETEPERVLDRLARLPELADDPAAARPLPARRAA